MYQTCLNAKQQNSEGVHIWFLLFNMRLKSEYSNATMTYFLYWPLLPILVALSLHLHNFANILHYLSRITEILFHRRSMFILITELTIKPALNSLKFIQILNTIRYFWQLEICRPKLYSHLALKNCFLT